MKEPKKTKRTQFPIFSKFQGSSKHVYPYSCIPVYLHTCFRKTNPFGCRPEAGR